MKHCTIDCRQIQDRQALHETMKAALALPEWYGNNLDGLYDCLTGLTEDTHLWLLHTEALDGLGDYGAGFCRVLADAARENPALRLTWDKKE